MADHALALLGLEFVDGFPDPDEGFAFGIYAEGASFGVGASVQEIVTSLLADGDLVRITRFGNREISFQVEITGPTLGSLAHGEAALRGAVGRGGDLVWQPPDTMALPTAFDVITSSMEFRFDDLSETRKRRVFLVTLTCLPFARSLTAVTVPALPTAAFSPTVVDACNSTSGWSSSYPGSTVTTSGGAVISTRVGAGDPATYNFADLVRTGSFSTSGTPYLLVEHIAPLSLLYVNGVNYFPIVVRLQANGRTLSVYDLPLMTVTSMRFLAKGVRVLTIYDVSRSSVIPQISNRQITRGIQVGGTERTPASIHVQTASGTGSLGQVLVHTCPEDGSGYSPPLRRWRMSASTGPVTTDTTTYSGAYEPIAFDPGGFGAEVPTSALPSGGYTLVARLRLQSAWTPPVRIYYSTSTIFPDGTTQEGYTNGSTTYSFTGTSWAVVPIVTLSLPSVRTSAGKVQIALQCLLDNPQVFLDEAWLFREDDDCALTIVDTARSHLWLDSPSATSAVPTVWVGDGSVTRVHPGTGLRAMGAHVLSPEGTAVFTAALSDNPATDATFHRRWHSNAAS